MKNTRIALSLALLLCILVPALALAAGPNDQLANTGGTVFYNAAGDSVSGPLGSNGAVVEMHKTLSPTGTENKFRVDLQVRTTQQLLEISSGTPDAALTLVFDLSNSMDDCALCGQELSHSNHDDQYRTARYCPGSNNEGNEYEAISNRNSNCAHCGQSRNQHRTEQVLSQEASCPYDSRLDFAKEAAIKFLNDFSKLGADDDGTVDAKRMVAIVTFASTAVTRLDYVDVATTSGLSNAISIINGLTPTNNGYRVEPSTGSQTITVSDNGGTNIEGALMLADNVIAAGINTNTPGKLTYVDDNGDRKAFDYLYTVLLTDGNPTYYVSSNSSDTKYIGGTRGGGSSTTDNDVDQVGDEAEDILARSAQSKLYSICFGKNAQKVDIFETKPFKNWNYVNPQTSSNDTVGDWLEKFSTKAYNGGANDLFTQFNAIMTQMQIAAQAWKVTDTMGPHMHNVEEIDLSGFENSSSIAEDGTITWDILTSDYNPSITSIRKLNDGSYTGILGYTYSYTVELDNLDGGYSPKTAATAANTQALLDYAVYDSTDGLWKPVNDKPFPIPRVRGLTGALSFTKKDIYDNLSGVNFYLTCQDDPSWRYPSDSDEYVTSAADTGLVSFTGLPSGHTYQLHEVTPSTHVQMGIIDFGVSWGEIVLPQNSKLENTENGLVLENERLADLYANITITKAFEGDALPEGTVLTFRIEDESHGYDTFTLSEANNWTHTFPGVAEGKYTVTEYPSVNGYEFTGVSGSVTVESSDGTETLTSTPTRDTENNPVLSFDVDLSNSNLDYTVSFTNTYRRRAGKLTLNKSFLQHTEETILGQGHETEDMDSSLYSGKTVTVNVYPTGSSQSVGTLTLNSSNGFSDTLEDLAPGRYTLREVAVTPKSDIDDYVFEHSIFTTVTIDDGSSEMANAENAVIVEVKDKQTTKVALENHYEKIHGFIYSIKLFSGDIAEEQFVAAYKAAHNGAEPSISVLIYKGDYSGLTQEEIADLVASGTAVSTLTLKPSEIAGEDGWRAASDLLPIDTYTLVEDATNAQLNGYDLTINHPIVITPEQFKHGQAHTVTLRNTYDQEETLLTIKKQFAAKAPSSVTDATEKAKIEADIRAAVQKHFMNRSINVDIRQNNTTVKTVELQADDQNPDGSWTVSVADLPYGSYTVFEELRKDQTNTAYMDEYALRAVWSEDDDFTLSPDNKEVTLIVTNTYEQEFANLEIKKDVDGLPVAVKNSASFSVSIVPVEDQADYRTVVLNSGNNFKATLYHFPAGEYSIVENYDGIAVENYDFTGASVTFNNSPLKVKDDQTGISARFEITPEMTQAQGESSTQGNTPTLTISVTNNYEPVPAKIIVNKQFPSTSDLLRAYFEGLTGFNGFTVNVSSNAADGENPTTLTLAPNAAGTYWTTEMEVQPGVEYTLSEVPYPVDGYQQSVYWVLQDNVNGNTSTQNTNNPNSISFTPQPGQTITLVVANSYDRISADGLIIKKEFNVPSTLIPDDMQDRINALSVTIKLTPVAADDSSSGQVPSGMTERTFVLNAGNGFTVNPTDLPVGRYKIEEVSFPALQGFEQAMTKNDADEPELMRPVFIVKKNDSEENFSGSAVVDIAAGVNILVGIVNYYEHADAELTLTKFFQSGSELTAANFSEVKVDVLTQNLQPLNPPVTFVLNAANQWSQMLSVPAGTYYLKEQTPFATADNTDLTDYTHTHFFTNTTGGQYTVFDGNTPVTLYGDDQVSVSLTNGYTKNPGSLTLSKTFAGPQDRWPQSVTFTITGTTYKGEPLNRTVTLPQNNQWNTTLTDLPEGSYTITENVTAGVGYRVTTNWQVNNADVFTGNSVNVSVTPADTTSIVCTNTYEDQMTVTLPITKTVSLGGTLPPPADSPFQFSLKLSKPDTVFLDITEKAGTAGTLVSATENLIKITMSGAGVWEGYLTFTGFAEDLAKVEFDIGETLDPYKTPEAAATAGWTYDVSALDGNKAYHAKLLNPTANKGLMTLARKDGTAAGGLDFTNIYTLNLPASGIPQTGDASNLPLWTLLLAVCGAAMLFLRRRRSA